MSLMQCHKPLTFDKQYPGENMHVARTDTCVLNYDKNTTIPKPGTRFTPGRKFSAVWRPLLDSAT